MKKRTYIIISCVGIVVVAFLVFLYFNYRRVEEESPVIDALDIVKSRIVDIDWSSYKTQDIKLDKNLNITTEGVYHLTGSINDGYIRINTKGKVKLILDNVKINNSKGPTIYIEDSKRVELELQENSTNTLTDSKAFVGIDADACIFSKEDLVISGNGTLEINANHALGVHTKKDLKISSGNISINAIDDGLCGKDSIEIAGGNITINSDKNGLKSTNIKDYDRGFIFIRDGNLKLNTRLDGIQAASALLIKDGNIEIETSGNPKEKVDGKSISSKGIKGKAIVIEKGNIDINSTDDAIHSNDYIMISSMNGTIKSGDDGIHADKKINIDAGSINIIDSYEGLEANEIIINGGDIKIKSSDDGINAASVKDEEKEEFHDGPRRGKEKGNSTLEINNGNIFIDALGDGIDINGKITMNGGELIIEGPQDDANGAIDYDDEFIINGGEVIAIGYKGMAQGSSDKSKQVGILINTTDIFDSKFSIKDSKGKSILSYEPSKRYNSIFVSSLDLQMDTTVSLAIDKTTIEKIDIDSISKQVGDISGNRNPGMPPDKKRPR